MSKSPAKVEKPADPVTADAGDDEDVDPKTFDLPKRDKVYLATDKKFEQKYDSLAELGKGKFGVVKKVKNKETGEVLAAKFIKTSAESKKEVLGEMEMMNFLHSKRLIYLADAYERPGEMIVIMELVTGGELFEKICQDDNLTEKEVIRYMRQILQGVEHMHRNNMVHLDLKPENVLCVIRPDGKEDLKLIDFGMAHILEKGKELKLACGTPEFVAPEVISYEPVHLASDMWSVGVIAYVLLSGLSPFMGDDDNETIMNVSTAEWDFEDESFDLVSDHSKKFIEELLLKDYSKRNDVYHCLGHEWLKKGKTMEAKKLSTDNLKKFIARRRWQKTSNALRALSRLGSLGLGGGGGAAPGGGGGGLLGKMKGKPQTKQENRLTLGESRGPPEVSMAGRRNPTLSGRRGPVQREANHGTPSGPPAFRLPLKDCEIVEGTAARFQCQVTGNPEPDVEWYKDGKKLRESKQLTFLYDENDNCKLIITEGRQKDAGEYKVVAVNRHGKVSCSAKLIIKEHASSDEESGGEASDSEISDNATDDEKDVGIRTESISKFYKIKDELGKGRFGVVCKCTRISDGKCFAAKFIKCSKEQEKKDVKHEIEIMTVIRHRRLLRLADAFESPTEIVLVMELVTGGELFEKVVEDEFISENDVIHYMKQIIEGVQHMHCREVLHLDLKPENIMIVRPGSRQIKLIDFGLARKYDPKENLKVMFGTPEFVAPEVLTYDRITPATDMWSIGVIAYVLLSGLSPFMGDNDAETLANVQTAEWDFDDPVFDDISDDAKEFISKLLVLKATKRITVEKCLKHPWLTEKRETGKRLKTDRLKAFTAKRKWKKALTAIRSTNFLSRLMGSRGSSDGTKKPNEEEGSAGGGGGGGLLARVKAMHSAGVQAPGSGPSSSPFLSPSSAENATPSAPATSTKSTTPSSKSPATTTAPSRKEPSAPSASKTETKPSTKTDSKATPSNNVSKEPKATDTNGVSSKATESNNNISNKEPEKAADRTKTPTPTTSPPKNTVNDTKKNSDAPASTKPAKVPTSSRKAPGKLPVWPPPPKERAQKREIQELVEKYSKSGIPLTPDNPENEYDIKDEIERGKFAVIKKCADRETKKLFAAKLIKFDENEKNDTVQEFDVHRSLKHKSLVTLFSAYIVQKYLVLVMELVEGQDALSSLVSKPTVTEDDVTSIIKPVLDALEYLHKRDIVHLDIRPANILVSQNAIKLIDFGCARRLTNKEGEVGAVVGNTEFSAPEMLSFEPVNSSSDIWSLGVTTFLLLSAELPFSGDDDDMVAEAVKTGTILINDDLFPSTTRQAKDFVKKLLSKIPRRRMDAATAKSHDWLSPSFGRERRKTPAAEPRKYKEVLDELLSQEEDELITASCVLRSFEEEPYESPDEEDDDDDDE